MVFCLVEFGNISQTVNNFSLSRNKGFCYLPISCTVYVNLWNVEIYVNSWNIFSWLEKKKKNNLLISTILLYSLISCLLAVICRNPVHPCNWEKIWQNFEYIFWIFCTNQQNPNSEKAVSASWNAAIFSILVKLKSLN